MKSIALFSFVALLGLTFSSGCRKKKDTTARITVRGVDNALKIGAKVRVAGDLDITDPAANPVDDVVATDYKGEAVFDYNDIYQLGQAGVAVLEIEATYGELKGEGVIKIEAEVENTETIYVQ